MSIEDDRDRTAGESHVFLTQTTLKYLPPRPSQQHRVFEWYVVFEREAREFQSFHTFIFQSTIVTRIAHSYGKNITRNQTFEYKLN